MQNNRTTTLSGMIMNSSYIHPSDNTQPLCFSSDLEELKSLFDFPEEVAIRLTEFEHEIFLSVPPLQYLRHLTLDMSFLPANDASIQGKSIRILVQRFQAVCFTFIFNIYHNCLFFFSGWIFYSTTNCFTK